MGRIVPNSFVAISDFHSTRWPLEKIKHFYINEYDKIFILGDVTDRGKDNKGTGGIDMLLEIKELTQKFKDRIVYIPGNHDQFLYCYMTGHEFGKPNLVRNGGTNTINELDRLKRQDPNKYRELVEWLGNLPIQRTHEFDDKPYALAHAFFNKEMYDRYPNLCLKDFVYGRLTPSQKDQMMDILWFRKGENPYDKNYVPSDKYTIVIGHTPENYRKNIDLDLTNAYGKKVKVVCVDGGIVSQNKMLKYDATSYEPISTQKFEHNDTSPKQNTNAKPKNDIDNTIALAKLELDKIIIECLNQGNADLVIIDALLTGNTEDLKCTKDIKRKIEMISNKYLNKIVTNIAIEKPQYLEGTNKMKKILKNYIYEVSLNRIIESLANTYNSYQRACMTVESFLAEPNFSYLTNDDELARSIAYAVGKNELKKTMYLNKCTNIREYAKKVLEPSIKEKRLYS